VPPQPQPGLSQFPTPAAKAVESWALHEYPDPDQTADRARSRGKTAESRCRTSLRADPVRRHTESEAEAQPGNVAGGDRRFGLRRAVGGRKGDVPGGSFGVGGETQRQPNRGSLRGLRRRCKQSGEPNLSV